MDRVFMLIVGIDPGKRGAVVALDEEGHVFMKESTPLVKGENGRDTYDLAQMRRMLRLIWSPCHRVRRVYLEQQHAMPLKMGGSIASFERGFSYGLWMMALDALGLPYVTVSPRRWQNRMLKDTPGNTTKERSIKRATQEWPDQDWRRTPQCKGPHDGLTDAALMALYGLGEETK